ncbi:hypothetical protein EON63_23210 [archaeon]|nr:MAG: hypothetical protein EON63_23210 [archaeon]
MGKLIRDETRTVNFQKASCTLDASVKIYSNRVDDTYASSHRILESLSRGEFGYNMGMDLGHGDGYRVWDKGYGIWV